MGLLLYARATPQELPRSCPQETWAAAVNQQQGRRRESKQGGQRKQGREEEEEEKGERGENTEGIDFTPNQARRQA